ncbi:MAG: NAD(P)/FAD-dependent oxidoreductase [Deltaproteobacteria bacterium]|nr:NAD(P)/FAD-dependent oxidoreductase [Deltaproteobacteria bacterium]
MKKHKQKFYHFVIAGAGPVGLTAGITAARLGHKVIIIEKGKIAGPRPRGESFRKNAFLMDLLGKDFFDKDCFTMGGGLVFHSPGAKKSARKPGKGKGELCFFEWRTFIDRLVGLAKDAGVEIKYNSKVLKPIINDRKICIGLEYKAGNNRICQAIGNTVLACDGYKSTIGKYYRVDYDQMDCPMVKCLAEEANIDIKKTPDLQFYLIGNGDLPYAGDFPPGVVYGFPIGGKKMELGLMLRMKQAHLMKTVKIPDPKTVMNVWKILKKEYPGFSDYFKGAKIIHEEYTGLSNTGLVDNFVPGKGVVLMGDSAGFIDPFGSSGLYSGMAMADFWVRMLSKKLKKLSENMPEDVLIDKFNEALWDGNNIKTYVNGFKQADIYKKISKSYALTNKFEWYIYNHLKTSDRINRWWNVISLMLKLA